MNRLELGRRIWRVGIGLVIAAGGICAVASMALAKDAETKPTKAKLTGADLYAINCNRCHSERYPTERTPGQWKNIVTHMRVRANLPAAQAREILKYMQENSGK